MSTLRSRILIGIGIELPSNSKSLVVKPAFTLFRKFLILKMWIVKLQGVKNTVNTNLPNNICKFSKIFWALLYWFVINKIKSELTITLSSKSL